MRAVVGGLQRFAEWIQSVGSGPWEVIRKDTYGHTLRLFHRDGYFLEVEGMNWIVYTGHPGIFLGSIPRRELTDPRIPPIGWANGILKDFEKLRELNQVSAVYGYDYQGAGYDMKERRRSFVFALIAIILIGAFGILGLVAFVPLLWRS